MSLSSKDIKTLSSRGVEVCEGMPGSGYNFFRLSTSGFFWFLNYIDIKSQEQDSTVKLTKKEMKEFARFDYPYEKLRSLVLIVSAVPVYGKFYNMISFCLEATPPRWFFSMRWGCLGEVRAPLGESDEGGRVLSSMVDANRKPLPFNVDPNRSELQLSFTPKEVEILASKGRMIRR